VIVITTPTGRIGSQVLARHMRQHDPIRVIVRDPTRLAASIRDRVQIIQGSHDNPAVLDQALTGADGLFWLTPPNAAAESAATHYLNFARPAAGAIRRHGLTHVVAVSSAGHGWPGRAGVLSAAFAMDAEIEKTGVAYRALSPPFFMENLLGQLSAIRDQGTLSLAFTADRPLASVAARDISATAAALLADLSWAGQEHVPVFGPDRLTPNEMAAVMSDVLGRSVSYRQLSVADVELGLVRRGASAGIVRDVTEMIAAGRAGIYDTDWAASTPRPTDFRTWCCEVLRPAALA
jgi:uncharacterized protein YbjT (DUF2867 family)